MASDIFFGLLPPVGFLPVADCVATGSPVTRVAARHGPRSADAAEVVNVLRSRVSQLAPQPGFWPATFFGSLARNGGILTWDTAYFALRQSYFVEPVANAALSDDAEAVITYYLVIENYTAWEKEEGTSTTAPLYVVFVKNQLWPPGNQPPFVIQQALVR